MSKDLSYDNYFLSYSGAKLPLNLVSPISQQEVMNRNTYFGVQVDDQGRNTLIHRIVYGEVDLEHRYGYDEQGNLKWAEILDDEGETQRLEF